MKKIDSILFNFLFGLVIPALCFLVFWWTSLLFTDNNRNIMISALAGLFVGSITTIAIKLIWKPDIYNLNIFFLISVYLFYNVGLFGFFMGVPIFHLILGVLAGYYWTKRMIYQNTDRPAYKKEIIKISKFTSIMTGIICLLSAIIALSSKSTSYDLKHMLRLSFDISFSFLVVSIIIGGAFLILFQYWLTKLTMTKILNANSIKKDA